MEATEETTEETTAEDAGIPEAVHQEIEEAVVEAKTTHAPPHSAETAQDRVLDIHQSVTDRGIVAQEAGIENISTSVFRTRFSRRHDQTDQEESYT